MSDGKCIITRDNISSNNPIDAVNVAEKLANICESRNVAIQFLEKVITALDPFHAPKKRPLAYEGKYEGESSNLKIARPEDCVGDSSGIEQPHADVIKDLYDDESRLDSATITLCVMIPNDVHLCSYLIGKKGVNISDIRRRTSAKTQIEQSQDIPVGCPDRHVFFMGTIRAVCEAFQLFLSRMMDKADSLPPTALDAVRMVVPSDLCAPLIGRGGVVIKKIQTDSGAHTHVQSEEDMRLMRHYFGRIVNITGSLRQQCHAILLLLKQLLQLKDFPELWRGGLPAGMGGLPMPHLLQQHHMDSVPSLRYQQQPQAMPSATQPVSTGGQSQGGMYYMGGGSTVSGPGGVGLGQHHQWIGAGQSQYESQLQQPPMQVASGAYQQQQHAGSSFAPHQQPIGSSFSPQQQPTGSSFAPQQQQYGTQYTLPLAQHSYPQQQQQRQQQQTHVYTPQQTLQYPPHQQPPHPQQSSTGLAHPPPTHSGMSSFPQSGRYR